MEQRFIDLYNERKTDKADPAALRSTPEGTRRRMSIAAMLIGVLDRLDSDTLKVLDVGCGFADLSEYLDKHLVEYQGVDAIDWVVEAAKAQRPNVNIIHGTIDSPGVEQADIVVALGVLATVPRAERAEFLASLYDKANVGIVVSFLDEIYEEHIECGFYAHSVEGLIEDVQILRPDLQLKGLIRPTKGITTLIALGRGVENHF